MVSQMVKAFSDISSWIPLVKGEKKYLVRGRHAIRFGGAQNSELDVIPNLEPMVVAE
jgi:hypothetical protein